MRALTALPILITAALSTTPAMAHTEVFRGSAVGSADTQVATSQIRCTTRKLLVLR